MTTRTPETELTKIEATLAGLDAENISFDYQGAERCKAVLVRIVQTATRLCREIKVEPSRADQAPKGWQLDHEAMLWEAARTRGPATKIEWIGGGITIDTVDAE